MTILKAYKSISTLREPAYFKTWIFRILINECNTLLSKRNRSVGVSEKDIVHLNPKQTLTNDSLSFTLSEVDVTPITTNVKYSLSALGKTKLSDDEASALMDYQVAVYDDKGNLLQGLNGEGMLENNDKGNKAESQHSFASAQQRPAYLIFKLFTTDDHDSFPYTTIKDSQFVGGMSIKVDIPSK